MSVKGDKDDKTFTTKTKQIVEKHKKPTITFTVRNGCMLHCMGQKRAVNMVSWWSPLWRQMLIYVKSMNMTSFVCPCFRFFFSFFLNIGLDFDIKFVSLRVSSLVAITKDFIEGNYINHKTKSLESHCSVSSWISLMTGHLLRSRFEFDLISRIFNFLNELLMVLLLSAPVLIALDSFSTLITCLVSGGTGPYCWPRHHAAAVVLGCG